MSTATRMARYVGQEGRFHTRDGLIMGVRILDARVDFGHIRVNITPLAGEGTVWVNAERVQINNPKNEGGPNENT